MINLVIDFIVALFISKKYKVAWLGIMLSLVIGAITGAAVSVAMVYIYADGVFGANEIKTVVANVLAHPIATVVFFLFLLARRKQREEDLENSFWICQKCEEENNIKLDTCESCMTKR